MTRVLWILGLATVACGGNVVFVEDGNAGGGGSTSNGGAPGTTSNTTAAVMQTTINTTNQATTDATTSVGGGTPDYLCEFGPVDDQCNQCFEDAQSMGCFEVIDACGSDQTCIDYADCVFNCANQQPCCEDCEAAFPVGGKLYSDAVFCIVCQFCPECESAVPGFCF